MTPPSMNKGCQYALSVFLGSSTGFEYYMHFDRKKNYAVGGQLQESGWRSLNMRLCQIYVGVVPQGCF